MMNLFDILGRERPLNGKIYDWWFSGVGRKRLLIPGRIILHEGDRISYESFTDEFAIVAEQVMKETGREDVATDKMLTDWY